MSPVYFMLGMCVSVLAFIAFREIKWRLRARKIRPGQVWGMTPKGPFPDKDDSCASEVISVQDGWVLSRFVGLTKERAHSARKFAIIYPYLWSE